MVSCWVLEQVTVARRTAVYPLIIGDKDHLYRPLPDDRYGVVVCVPVLKVAYSMVSVECVCSARAEP